MTVEKAVKFIQPAINIRKTADQTFNAYKGNEMVGIFAVNIKAAHQFAIEYFKPKKRERHHIVVKPAEV